jgi:hypothetical protein
MNNEERLIEVMAELLAEVHEMRKELIGMRGDISEFKGQQIQTNSELAKVNVLLSENSRAIIKLADNSNLVERIIKLETIVYRKAS